MKPGGGRAKDMTGLQFGYWTVVARDSGSRWICRCVCGVERSVPGDRLRRRRSESCGCMFAQLKARHRQWSPLTKSSYDKMRARCTDKKHPSFANYGGRGISVCQRWLDSPRAFVADMGERPSKRHTLDRIDNDGNYEPSNCRWSTWEEQHRNRRNNRILEHGGESMCLTDWAAKTGITATTLDKRLRLGWGVSRALTEPIHGQRKTQRK